MSDTMEVVVPVNANVHRMRVRDIPELTESELGVLDNIGTGVTCVDGVRATSTLTVTGGGSQIVDGSQASTILTVTATADPGDGKVVVIGSGALERTYTFKTNLTTATTEGEVLIGATSADSLVNLKAAINGEAGAGTTYGSDTTANATFYCSATGAATLTIYARVPGTATNAEATTTDSTDWAWAGAAVTNGTAGIAADFVTIGSTVYTFVTALTETSGAAAIPYEILAVGSDAVILDNLKKAINASGTEGTHYSTGTEAHPSVTAEDNTNTTQVIQAIAYSADDNSTATTSDSAECSWTSTVMAGGVTCTPGELGALRYKADGTYAYIKVGAQDWQAFPLGITGTPTEINYLDITAPGTVEASKAVVVNSDKDIGDFRNLDAVNIDAGASGTAGSVDVFPATIARGKLAITVANQTGDTTVTLNANAMGQATQVNIADPGIAASYVPQSTAALTVAEVDTLDGIGTAITAANGVRATSTLTITAGDGQITAGAQAITVLTVSNVTNAGDGKIVTIGSAGLARVYTFKTALTTATTANEVLIGLDSAASLVNLKMAINKETITAGQYGSATVANATFIATATDATSLTIKSRTPGTATNAEATTTDSTDWAWAGAAVTNGTPGVAGETVTIGATVYMFVAALTQTSGAAAIANEVLDSTTDAAALDNLKLAINGGATAGTNYSTGTVAHTTVTAEANADDSQAIQAIAYGTAGNSIATTDTMNAGAWTSTVMTTGADVTPGPVGSWRFNSGATEGYVKTGAQVWKKFALAGL